jgi:hypothetical protein
VGVVVYRYFKAFGGLPAVAVLASIPAQSEELLLSYRCAIEHSEVRLHPATETSYRILGKREEQIFTVCPPGPGASCTNMMIHRFNVLCGAERVSWARIAHAAYGLGIEIPRQLPNGFAPVTPLGGRFVLPALAPVNPAVTQVTTQDLSPDGVVDHAGDGASPAVASWVTVVKSDVRTDAGGGALRVAAAVTSLMLALLAASYVAAGRLRISLFEIDDLPQSLERFRAFSKARWTDICSAASMQCSRIYNGWRIPVEEDAGESLVNALMMAKSRLESAEAVVAALPVDLLLRDVLSAELKRVQLRIHSFETDRGRKQPSQVASQLRSAMRELDRIAKIAQSAGQTSAAGAREDDTAIPQSLREAYQVLGLNRNAAPEIAKKLVVRCA